MQLQFGRLRGDFVISDGVEAWILRDGQWQRTDALTAFVLAQISKFVTAADGIRAGTCSLSGSTLIPMVQTANFWEGHDVAGGRLYGTRPRAVLAERKMCSGVMMVVKIAR